MKIYLVRHGQANSADIDPEKGLSKSGKIEIKKVAESIRHLKINVKEIWHSGKVRARQTAEILASTVSSSNGLIEKSGLNPNDDVKPVIDEIKAVNSDIMLVGHLPFMAKLASMMLVSNENKCNITFSTGALACFNYDKDSFSLDWFIYPGLIAQGDIGSFQSYH